MNRKNRNLVHNVKNLDEFLDLTDSEESSSSSDMQVFERNEAFVLELHELQRDELPDNPLPEVKTRKLLKKKKRGQLPATEHSESSLPSSSLSDSSVAPVGSDAKEEFYDAHESYHALPANQVAAAVTSTAVMKVISEHAPKPSPPAQAPPAPQPAEVKLPTSKPVTPPPK
ncbi:hypothetical protein MSG28_007284 [Choristoneura fumiferana]|uniref:Uncharacterized protein n=1 Tax=Choristoneura fumiferana TaxID=7141 RepID=A0ACC0JX02_CHOFU|nr:hypothetical protein MSG28_007284 [Choristoneura fumiferana]